MKEVARRDELIGKHIEEFKVRMNGQMMQVMIKHRSKFAKIYLNQVPLCDVCRKVTVKKVAQ